MKLEQKSKFQINDLEKKIKTRDSRLHFSLPDKYDLEKKYVGFVTDRYNSFKCGTHVNREDCGLSTFNLDQVILNS